MILKQLCLGTALWGWQDSSMNTNELLDIYYDSGYRYIDAATIYPIDKNPSSMGAGMKMISSWSIANGVNHLKVIVKAGGVNNLGSSLNNTSIDFLKNQNDYSRELLGDNFYCLMLHWDNETDISKIKVNCDSIKKSNQAPEVGLSGVSKWTDYLDQFNNDVYVEVKNNILYNGVASLPSKHLNRLKVFTYGTSVSGLKLQEGEYKSDSYVRLARDSNFHSQQISKLNINNIITYINSSNVINSFYHLGILHNILQQDVSGVIVGPRSIDQLNDIIKMRKQLEGCYEAEKLLYDEHYLRFFNE